LTVTVPVTEQPVDVSVKVTVAVPVVTPLTIPEAEPTVIEVELLAHVPAPDGSLNVSVAPAQIAGLPIIASGNELTVTVVFVEHPSVNV
jgi:hypothetical protein